MKRILCFGAHPDDIEFGCGGTIARFLKQNAQVTFVCFTSGESGHQFIEKKQLAMIREKEALAAAGCLGVQDLRFMRFPDGLTEFNREMKIQVINLIRALKPDLVFTHATSDHFPDHQIFSRLTLEALTGAAGPWYQESVGVPHRVPHIYGYEVWQPMQKYQIAQDISEFIDLKIASLQCHASQIGTIGYDQAARGLAAYRGTMSMAGAYAEVFEVICTILIAPGTS